ncbi:hypothetical protein V8C86DRAFT_2531822 [Haematococcus lacustris]
MAVSFSRAVHHLAGVRPVRQSAEGLPSRLPGVWRFSCSTVPTQQPLGAIKCCTATHEAEKPAPSLWRVPMPSSRPPPASGRTKRHLHSNPSALELSQSPYEAPASPWRPLERSSKQQLVEQVDAYLQVLPACPPSQAWLQRCSDSTQPHLRSLSPQQLCSVLATFRLSSWHPGAHWAQHLDEAACSHPCSFDPSTTCEVLACLASAPHPLRHSNTSHNPESHASAPINTLNSVTITPSHLPGPFAFPAFVALRLQSGLEGWQHPQLAFVLRCMRLLSCQLADSTLQAVGVRMAECMRNMSPAEVRQLLQQPSLA